MRKDTKLQCILLTVIPYTVGQTPCRLPGRQSPRVHAEADKETELGKEAKPQEAGGNFYNDERPVSLAWPSVDMPLQCHSAKQQSYEVIQCLTFLLACR